MISIGKTMGFVTDSLEQVQRARVVGQSQGQGTAGAVNFFVFLGQTDNRQLVQTKSLQLAAGGRELSFSAIDDNQIRQPNVGLRIADWREMRCAISAGLS